ncbi:MAG: methionyl-tRNA formyltransferase [Actinomycetaceae bacterium]|nr:methionyl-tRNA formyltransferase [Actinomycetaceae bacterium]
MKILLVGTPDVALKPFQALLESEHEIVGVLTRPPAARGRSRKLIPSAVGKWAEEHNLPTWQADNLRAEEIQRQLIDSGAQLGVVVAYGALIPESLLAAFEYGFINLHFSALPRWRGAAPVQRAIEAADETTATTVFQLETGLDTGPIYDTRIRSIEPDVDAGTLLQELSEIGARQLVDVVSSIEAGTANPQPQPEQGVTIAPKITREELVIDVHAPATVIHNFVRARSPQPGAYLWDGQQRMKILATKPAATKELKPGQLRATKKQVFMGTGEGDLELLTLAPAGKSKMAAADWARGARIGEGEKIFTTEPQADSKE